MRNRRVDASIDATAFLRAVRSTAHGRLTLKTDGIWTAALTGASAGLCWGNARIRPDAGIITLAEQTIVLAAWCAVRPNAAFGQEVTATGKARCAHVYPQDADEVFFAAPAVGLVAAELSDVAAILGACRCDRAAAEHYPKDSPANAARRHNAILSHGH